MAGRTTVGNARGGRRVSDVELLHRREEVRLLLLEERWNPGTRADLSERYGVGDRQLWLDRKAVRLELTDGMSADAKEYRERLAGRFRHAFTLSITNGEYNTAVSATREEGKMMGVYAPERHETHSTHDVNVKIDTPLEQALYILRTVLPEACEVAGIAMPELDLPILEVDAIEAK